MHRMRERARAHTHTHTHTHTHMQLSSVTLLLFLLGCSLSTVSGLEVHYPEWSVLEDITGLSGRATVGDPVELEQAMQPARRSQDGEDSYLYSTYFCGVKGGTFLELGALDGLKFSNTYAFEQALDWRGVLIEANPDTFKQLVINRPLAVRAHTAVCHRPRLVHWISSDAVGGIWEFMAKSFRQQWHSKVDIADPKASTVVPCHPISAILQFVGIRHFNFLSLDVEGGELEVLKSVRFNQLTFDVIFIEADNHDHIKNQAVRDYLQVREQSSGREKDRRGLLRHRRIILSCRAYAC
jgi:FkbM family methyltransferase